MTLAWIVNGLPMGTWTYISNPLRRIHAEAISRRNGERQETGSPDTPEEPPRWVTPCR